MTQSFQQDCVALLGERLARGEISRRAWLAGLAALGAPAGLAQAQAGRMGGRLHRRHRGRAVA
ncbi:MAG: hypothetical protein EBX37_14270 [Alphaproteobacteria bacterium]|nr:hypothetical protein [Alphaproteobacteria bacterium]